MADGTGKAAVLRSGGRADPAGAYVLEDQVGYQLRKAHQRASELFSRVMGRFDVTPTQFAALAKLDDVGEISPSALGRLTAMDPATILGVITRLKKRGFVAQRLDPGDRRRILLRLTHEGARATAAMKAAAADVSKLTLAPLSGREAESFLALLRKLQEAPE